MIPLPHEVRVERYVPGETDAHGNPIDTWGAVEWIPAAFWVVGSQEPAVSGHDRVLVDAAMFVASELNLGPHDRVTIPELGGVFEVLGYGENVDHGPFGFRPGRMQINLRRVEG